MATPEKVPLGRRVRHGMKSYRAWVAIVILVVGVFLTVLAVGFFTPLANVGSVPRRSTARRTARTRTTTSCSCSPARSSWSSGMYMVGAYFVARRKFEHLMQTKSKAEFLRNIPELEDLLWDLTPRDELRYEAKRAELRVRR